MADIIEIPAVHRKGIWQIVNVKRGVNITVDDLDALPVEYKDLIQGESKGDGGANICGR
jgi:hypothetical protein